MDNEKPSTTQPGERRATRRLRRQSATATSREYYGYTLDLMVGTSSSAASGPRGTSTLRGRCRRSIVVHNGELQRRLLYIPDTEGLREERLYEFYDCLRRGHLGRHETVAAFQQVDF